MCHVNVPHVNVPNGSAGASTALPGNFVHKRRRGHQSIAKVAITSHPAPNDSGTIRRATIRCDGSVKKLICKSDSGVHVNEVRDDHVDTLDLGIWIEDLFGSSFGDANLDGVFGSNDSSRFFRRVSTRISWSATQPGGPATGMAIENSHPAI